MKKVVVVGSLNYDFFLLLAGTPKVGETVHANESGRGAGGKGADQAVQIAKLGTPVSMVGSIGNDWMGTYLRESLIDAGVDCTYLKRRQDVETGMSVANVLPDGNIMSVILHGANYGVEKADVLEAMPALREAEMIVLQLEIPMEVVKFTIDLAKELGIEVLLNAAPAAVLEEEYIRKCDYFVVNEVEASFYAGEEIVSVEQAEKRIPELAENYGNCWICTLGEAGALIAGNGEYRHIPAVKTQMVEATGAGDSFVGGFSHGVLEGMDVFQAGWFAAHCSAITIRNVGAQASMPRREQLRKEYGI